ncbi:MAG: SpoIIE family protein phosphatase [Parasporobacterium sp.]|nr:SpoIIE family protein phosphatase [Parasporobacterium sp.]
MENYLLMGVSAVLPVIFCLLLDLLNKKTSFGKLDNRYRQLIIGIIFGGLAVLGTEFGIPIEGAVINCRDASVLTAGLVYGGPAGIIAGIIGGVERFLAVYWGAGMTTRFACSISTILAGLVGAFFRRFFFDSKRPRWVSGLFLAFTVETVHMLAVFVENSSNVRSAYDIVIQSSPLMLSVNTLSVAVALFFVGKNPRCFITRSGRTRPLSATFLKGLALCIILAFIMSTTMIYLLDSEICRSDSQKLLTSEIEDVKNDIIDKSDAKLLNLVQGAGEFIIEIGDFSSSWLRELAHELGLSEIDIVDSDGIVIGSNSQAKVGSDFSKGTQSAEIIRFFDTNATEYVQPYQPTAYNPNKSMKYAAIKTRLPDTNKDVIVIGGYNRDLFQKDIDEWITVVTKNRHVGIIGNIFAVSETMKIIADYNTKGDIYVSDTSTGLYNVLQYHTVPEFTEFEVNILGERKICMYAYTEGYYIVASVDYKSAVFTRDVSITLIIFLEIVIFGILFAMIYSLLRKRVVRNIHRINLSLHDISHGNLDTNIDIRDNQEFSELSDDINETVATLKHFIAEASSRIDQELQLAKDIQLSVLPNKFPAYPKRKEFDIYAYMTPAKEVGGDFYDFYMTDYDTINFLVADVSGKGIPAAMFMMRAKTELKTLTESDIPIEEVFIKANNALCTGNDAGMFVTAWQGALDLSTGLVRFANGGHNPPVLRHKNGRFEFLRSRAGFILAGMEDVQYRPQEIQLSPGDIIFLYTDGVTEATDIQNTLYGEERLLSILNSREFDSMEDLCHTVKRDVDDFVGEAPQFDDITMVALKFTGKPPVPSITIESALLKDIPTITDFAEEVLDQIGCPIKTVYQINVAIDEICSNIIKYGYGNQGGPVNVQFIERTSPHRIHIRFEDSAVPYNPLKKDDPDVTLSAEEREAGGLGIYLVKKTMDNIRYKYENGKNILTITKNLE